MENINVKNKIITGYPHIDQPWRQFYSDYFNEELPVNTILEYIKLKNKGNLDKTALTYYKKEISYDELFDYINDASKALKSLSLNKADRIMYLMPNIPETAYTLYGGSQLGYVSDYIDPRPDSLDMKISSQKVLKMIEREKVKQIIALDQCYIGMIAPIANELKEMGMNNIVVVDPSTSMDLRSTADYMSESIRFDGFKSTAEKIKHMKKVKEQLSLLKSKSPLEIIDYADLLKNSRYTRLDKVDIQKDDLAAIVHTSGTTGLMPKPIPLTHVNINAYANQTTSANMPMETGDRALHVLPYFAAFGLCGVAHGGLVHGCNLLQIPEFSPVNFGKLIMKYKPQIIIGTPTWFISMIDDPELQNADLSFITMATYGGDSMEPEDEMRVNEFLKAHNCKCVLTKGHGMSETCGCASYATNEYNDFGYMGIPMPGVTYGVVDPETMEFKKYTDDSDYVEGEFVISSKTVTPGVLDDEVIVQHYDLDGKDFIRTKDIGRMYKDGKMQFLQRGDRTFTRFDGYKYKAYEIEDMLKEDPQIKYCVITPYHEEKYYGNMPMVDIVLEDDVDLAKFDKEEFVSRIINERFISNPNISSRQIPARFRFKTELPITKNGKVDFVGLKNEDPNNCDIFVDVDETNIQIAGIKIYSNKNVKKLVK